VLEGKGGYRGEAHNRGERTQSLGEPRQNHSVLSRRSLPVVKSPLPALPT
jgi:hypothetical protein